MNFLKVFIFVAFVFAVFAAQTEAGWLKKIGKRLVRILIVFVFLYDFSN